MSVAPLAVALALLAISILVAAVLIPALDDRLRRTTDRWAANDNSPASTRQPERQFG